MKWDGGTTTQPPVNGWTQLAEHSQRLEVELAYAQRRVEMLEDFIERVHDRIDSEYDYAPDVGECPFTGAGELLTEGRRLLRHCVTRKRGAQAL